VHHHHQLDLSAVAGVFPLWDMTMAALRICWVDVFISDLKKLLSAIYPQAMPAVKSK
jgi:hypothetical protein